MGGNTKNNHPQQEDMTRRFFSHCLMPALLLAVCCHGSARGVAESAVIIIAAPGGGQEAIPLSTLRAMFGMRPHRWPDGTPVRVFVFGDDAPEHQAFSKQVLQVFPHQLRQNWDRLVFSGLGQYPQQVASSQEMLSRVAATPGAVGYVMASEVNLHVRVLQLRLGKSPSTGYASASPCCGTPPARLPARR